MYTGQGPPGTAHRGTASTAGPELQTLRSHRAADGVSRAPWSCATSWLRGRCSVPATLLPPWVFPLCFYQEEERHSTRSNCGSTYVSLDRTEPQDRTHKQRGWEAPGRQAALLLVRKKERLVRWAMRNLNHRSKHSGQQSRGPKGWT